MSNRNDEHKKSSLRAERRKTTHAEEKKIGQKEGKYLRKCYKCSVVIVEEKHKKEEEKGEKKKFIKQEIMCQLKNTVNQAKPSEEESTIYIYMNQ